MFKLEDPGPKSHLDNLYYEVLMLNLVRVETPRNRIENNARLESFLIHARNLIDFLEDKRTNKKDDDDLSCKDFDDEKGNGIPKIPVDIPDEQRQAINKHLHHLTKVRETSKPTDWGDETMRAKINEGLTEFFDQLSPTYFPTGAGKRKDDFYRLLTLPRTSQRESDPPPPPPLVRLGLLLTLLQRPRLVHLPCYSLSTSRGTYTTKKEFSL